MLWLVLGDLSAGKTLFLVLNGVSSEFKVLGNFNLYIDNYTKISPIDLKEMGFSATILLDEMYTWLESHMSGSFLNQYIVHIANQSQKRYIDVFGTIHTFMSVDYRFRALANRIVLCERVGVAPTGVRRLEDTRDFKFKIMNTFDGSIEIQILAYKDAIKYFKLYDTNELLDPIQQDKWDLELMRYHPDKLYDKIIEIAEMIEPTLDKLTHAKVQMALLKRGLPISNERLIYSYLMAKNQKIKGE